jgi:hypothetical protein
LAFLQDGIDVEYKRNICRDKANIFHEKATFVRRSNSFQKNNIFATKQHFPQKTTFLQQSNIFHKKQHFCDKAKFETGSNISRYSLALYFTFGTICHFAHFCQRRKIEEAGEAMRPLGGASPFVLASTVSSLLRWLPR